VHLQFLYLFLQCLDLGHQSHQAIILPTDRFVASKSRHTEDERRQGDQYDTDGDVNMAVR